MFDRKSTANKLRARPVRGWD